MKKEKSTHILFFLFHHVITTVATVAFHHLWGRGVSFSRFPRTRERKSTGNRSHTLSMRSHVPLRCTQLSCFFFFFSRRAFPEIRHSHIELFCGGHLFQNTSNILSGGFVQGGSNYSCQIFCFRRCIGVIRFSDKNLIDSGGRHRVAIK